MQESLITFETAKLAKEKGFNIKGRIVFDLKDNNKVIDFQDMASKTFIEDCKTGYREKGLKYFIEDYKKTDDNTDDGYYILAPTQSLLQRWLREVHNIDIIILPHGRMVYRANIYKNKIFMKAFGLDDNYEELLEQSLLQSLNLIPETT